MSDFDTLGLKPVLLAALKDAGLTTPTPIQDKAIPLAMAGNDVLGLAQTGTGKTMAFGIPLVSHLMDMPERPAAKTAKSLILAPTRELVNQIAEALRTLTKKTHLKVNVVVGGQSINKQIHHLLKGTDILVATPGRLIDLMDRKAVDLRTVKHLVLDEADQMLDMGFIHALRRIAPLLAKDRQTMMFSATMPKLMGELANTYLTDAVRVQVNPPGQAVKKINQSVHFVAQAAKTDLLVELLDKHRDELAIVFGRTKHGCEKLYKVLEKKGFAAASIHGNKSQGQRQRALDAFKAGKTRVLVATDVAARGLDIPDVRFVYNYDLPNVAENYVHRIGRTARAGADGSAVALVAPDEMIELKDIEKAMKETIPVASGREWDILPGQKKRPNGGGGGRRGGGGNRGGGQRASGKPGGGQAKSGGRRRNGGGGNRSRGQSAA